MGVLTGFPFPAGAGRVYLVNTARNVRPQVFADAFTIIIDRATDKHGGLYGREIGKDGLVAPTVRGTLPPVQSHCG